MVAPLAIAAGLAGRYGAKKVIKGLASKAQKKAAKEQNKVVKEINSAPKPTGAAKVKADKARDKFMDKLNKTEPGPKNKQNFKEKGTKLDKKKKPKGYKKGGSIDGCAIKGHTRAKR
jgi:hypothetical protein|tara:strand:+ start:188 stop:538 length:351 start_codon:yes stop_codon:yes gene_type:complete